jgi:hypothetical protein
MRNDITYCGAPPVESSACSICVYGEDRRLHVQRMRYFFQQIRPTILAPSRFAAELWLARSGLPHLSVNVADLAQLILDQPVPTVDATNRPLRVAYTGNTGFHKGWHVFADLASRHTGDPRYEFFRFGENGYPSITNCRHISVRVTRHERNAMVEALQRECIDVVILWSMCPETFSFTAHEALAAGAFVITATHSGNIPRVVRTAAPDQGIVLDKEVELFELFESGEICTGVAKASRRSGRLIQATSVADAWLNAEWAVTEVAV